MEVQHKSVKEISKTIGINNRNVIKQAMEYLRLLTVKINFTTTNEYARIVMCLDISATNANEAINFVRALNIRGFFCI